MTPTVRWWASILLALFGVAGVVVAYLQWASTPGFPYGAFIGGLIAGALIGAAITGFIFIALIQRKAPPIPSRAASLEKLDNAIHQINQAIVRTGAQVASATAQLQDSFMNTREWMIRYQADRESAEGNLKRLRSQLAEVTREREKVSAMSDRQWRSYARKRRR